MHNFKSGVLAQPSMLAMIMAVGVTMPLAPALAQEAAMEASSADTGDIIVTARRREENILKTPVAVAALTSEDISARGIVSLNDVANSTPGINISNVSSGRSDRSFQQISLRGFTPSTGAAILVSSFIDGVPVASSTALNNITDPERIEVLKGPQAAYFGRNTFAGAVNVVNKLPRDGFGGSFSVMGGTRDNVDLQGSIEGTLIPDLLTARLTGRLFAKDGSYKNQANLDQTLGDQSTRTGTLFLVAKPSDRLTIKAFGMLSKDKDGPSAQGMLSAYEIRADNGALNIPALSGSNAGTVIVPNLSTCNLNGFTSGLSATETRVLRPYFCGAAPKLPKGFSPAQNTLEDQLLRNALANGDFRVVSPEEGVQGYGLKRRYYHLHLNVDYELGDTGITLSSLTGYNNEYVSQLQDLDNYDSSLLANPANPGGANPNRRTFWDFPFLVERTNEDFSQELRATYDNDGPLTGVVGASYLLTKAASDLVSIQGQIVNGNPRPASSLNAPQKAKTTGVFFGLTYALTDQFKISAEGRYQQDRIYAISGGSPAGVTINPGNSFGLPPGTFGALEEFYSKKFKNFLPRVIAQYDISDDLMAYASWSKGANINLASFNTSFLNGSPTIRAAAADINLGVIVKPEKLENYEIGLKGKFFDGRVRASLAAYYGKWKDQHNIRSVVVQDEPPPTGTGNVQIVSGTANSGDTIVKGIELDLTAEPVDGLSINIGAALNESNVRSFADPAISKVTGLIGNDFRGNQLPGSSKYSANAGIQYGTPVAGWEDGAWFVRGDLSYKSKIYTDPGNLSWIRAREQVNFRAGVSKGNVSVEAFVLNAFNNRDYVSVANNTPLVPNFSISATNGYLSVGLPELRTAGIKTSVKF